MENDYGLRVCKGCYMHVRKTVGFLWQEGWLVQKAQELGGDAPGMAAGVQGRMDTPRLSQMGRLISKLDEIHEALEGASAALPRSQDLPDRQ